MIIIVIGEFKVNRPSPIMSTVDDRFLRKSRIQPNPIDTSPSTAAVIIAFVQTIAIEILNHWDPVPAVVTLTITIPIEYW